MYSRMSVFAACLGKDERDQRGHDGEAGSGGAGHGSLLRIKIIQNNDGFSLFVIRFLVCWRKNLAHDFFIKKWKKSKSENVGHLDTKCEQH